MKKPAKNLPKHIAMMVEKGNLVSAIKNLSSEEDISMDEAKDRIDVYEHDFKSKQQRKQQKITLSQNDTNKFNFLKIILGLVLTIILIIVALLIIQS